MIDNVESTVEKCAQQASQLSDPLEYARNVFLKYLEIRYNKKKDKQ